MSIGAIIGGSVFFLALALGGCIGVGAYVNSQTIGSRQTKMENRDVARITTFIGVFCMWMMWLVAYMHQMNPLIQPIQHGKH